MLKWPTPILTHLYIIFRHMAYAKTWRTTWRHTIRPTIKSVTPPLKNECQGPRLNEGRMLEPGASWIFGLRAKMYSILLHNGKPKFRAKGVSRRYILKHLNHKDYLRTLKGTESTIATFSTIRSLKQQINTLEVTKQCLSIWRQTLYP